MPKISIITPAYNNDRYISQTIASVQAQTLTDWEQIIVDDGSRDRSAEIARSYSASDSRIRLIQQPNGGACKARNVGFAAASQESEYLLFLDADDCLKPEMLETFTSYLDQHSEAGLVYGDFTDVDENGAVLDVPHFPRYAPTRFGLRSLPDDDPKTSFVSLLSSVTMPSITVLRRSVYQKTTGWDEAFGQYFEDSDLFLRVALHAQCHYLSKSLINYRRHAQQVSVDGKKHQSQEKKLYRKWIASASLTNEQKALFRSAYRFRLGRVIPYRGWLLGNRYVKQGDISRAFRFYGGALRRYFWSLLPERLAFAEIAKTTQVLNDAVPQNCKSEI
ncbi:glycosyltransferase family 2 protein [Phormidesmis priestleyi]